MPQHRSVLFLSCDIVGSTEFKQRKDSDWKRVFLSFYREFPQQLEGAKRAYQRSPHCAALDFRLWKAVGDELIFSCNVQEPREVSLAIRIWIDAMDQFDASTLCEHGLATKGGVFVATFPGPDSECSIPVTPDVEAATDKPVEYLNSRALEGRDSDRFMFDYFGPSFDTGFRLFGKSTARFFVLSVEAAMSIQYCAEESKKQVSSFPSEVFDSMGNLAFLGETQLKGVWSGREYPLFAVDRKRDEPVNRAMRSVKGEASQESIGQLCRACLNDDDWPTGIYLPKATDEVFLALPDNPAALPDNQMEGAESDPGEAVGDDEIPEVLPLE